MEKALSTLLYKELKYLNVNNLKFICKISRPQHLKCIRDTEDLCIWKYSCWISVWNNFNWKFLHLRNLYHPGWGGQETHK